MWYTNSGMVVETVPKKTGDGVRKATVKDAREYGWVPRYSTVANYRANHVITEWRVETAIKLAQAQPGLSYDELVQLLDDESDKRMNKGAEIHKTLERHFKNQETLMYQPVIDFVENYLKPWSGRIVELPVITKWFGGTPDIVALSPTGNSIIDFKTTADINKIKNPYDSWIMQVAAYEFALEQNTAVKGKLSDHQIIVIDQNTLECKVLPIKTDDAKQEFVALLYTWCIAQKMPVYNLKEYL